MRLSFLRTLIPTFFVMGAMVGCALASPPTPVVVSEPSVFDVIRPDGTAKSFTMEDLKALPFSSIDINGKPQKGPSVLDILAAAGITDFRRVTLSGEGSITLEKEQVTSDLILDFNNQGIIKLTSPDLPISSQVKDVTLITVE